MNKVLVLSFLNGFWWIFIEVNPPLGFHKVIQRQEASRFGKSETSPGLKQGAHGSLTPAEMRIPWCLWVPGAWNSPGNVQIWCNLLGPTSHFWLKKFEPVERFVLHSWMDAAWKKVLGHGHGGSCDVRCVDDSTDRSSRYRQSDQKLSSITALLAVQFGISFYMYQGSQCQWGGNSSWLFWNILEPKGAQDSYSREVRHTDC